MENRCEQKRRIWEEEGEDKDMHVAVEMVVRNKENNKDKIIMNGDNCTKETM